MKVHLLSGFLGSGKTTAIQKAASMLMQQGTSVGVITNDQGIKLVDGNFFKSLDIPSREVINGCFCCNYNDLDSSIDSLIEANQPEIIFAESVGSCTDIVATVMKPLLQYRTDIEVTLSTFADARLLYMLLSGTSTSFDESVTYIYYKQLEDAGIIVISKIDLMSAADLDHLAAMMSKTYANKTLIYQNSLDAVSLKQWLEVLEQTASHHTQLSLDIDYDIYGAGEAMLAWLDEEIEIFSAFDSALQESCELMNLIYGKIVRMGYSIGHLKFLLDDTFKFSFTSTSQNTAGNMFEQKPSASLLINARVQTTPKILSNLVDEAIAEISLRSGSTVVVNSLSAFQPGYPTPTHRI